MNGPLPLAKPDDPRLDEVLGRALRACSVDPAWAGTVRKLATGETSPRTMHCCGSGCRPCVQDLLKATSLTLRALEDPSVLPSGGRLRRGVRRVAGRLKRLRG